MGDDQRSNLERNRAAQAPRSRGPHDSTGYQVVYEIFEQGVAAVSVLIMSLTRVLIVPPDSRTWSFQLSDAAKHLDR